MLPLMPNQEFKSLKADQTRVPMTAVVVEEGLSCLTQLAIWSALLLGVAGTALGAASFASSQQNNGLIKDYIYSPPSAPPATVVGDQYCLEAVFADLRSRDVQLWTARSAGSGVATAPVVYSVAPGDTTAQATTLGAPKVSNLLQLLGRLNNFLPVFSPNAVLGGVVTVAYTQAGSELSTSLSDKLLTSFTLQQTTGSDETPSDAAVTVAGSLYLTPATVSTSASTIIGFRVNEGVPSLTGHRKLTSYQSDTSRDLPQVKLYLTLEVTSIDGATGTVTTTPLHQHQSVTYDFKLSGRLLPNGKILHMITLEPNKAQTFSATTTFASSDNPIAVHNVLTKLPTLYWELEEDASCELV